ncbi:MAG: DUF4968 domain-containing protein [Melioribacter sp.]|nr:DUF4968 domain-containing protein [Melioribacter sp.]
MRKIFLLFLILFIQTVKPYEKQKDGLLFHLKKEKETNAKLLKLQVIDENIVRVIASPIDAFSNRESLIIEKKRQKLVKWQIKNYDDFVELSTSRLIVKVKKQDGKISFYDKNGNLLLTENANVSKIFTPANVMGENTFHIQQIFDSPEDEAYYGLGAHQNGIMNYKGYDVDLWQYNIVDVVPFLVSSKNYGILWDNYSRTKFGDIRNYQSLPEVFKLYDKNGKLGGLTADYFSDENFSKLYTTQTESKIEHEHVDVNDPFPSGFNENVKAVRWCGEIEGNQLGVYKLKLYCSGYTKMWIDDSLVVDSWRQNWLPWNHFFRINMKPGEKHKIKIEWLHSGGYIGLRALPPPELDYNKLLSLYSDVGDQIDYYFIYGKNLDEVIQGYRFLTGKAPMMPKWAMGLWQCRERYKTQDELISVVKEFRQRKIPLDNIVQDWFYWKEDQWGSHEFDNERYPDPAKMVKELHEKYNTRIMISVWPKFYVGTKHFEEFKKNGWLYMRNVELGQKDWVGPGYVSTFYDPYSEGARKLYWKQIQEKLFSLGFDAWWLDSTEPDLQSNLSFNEWLLRIGPTALGTSARYLNTYSLMNSKAVYEGQRKTKPNQRVFILTRSAFAGQQRYSAATWSGDVAARWFDLKNQIPAGLNFSLSGIPYWTTDIGGFAVEPRFEKPTEADLEEWRELNTRWFQFGTFCPIFRVHGQYPYREMFNIAPENHPSFQSMLKYDKLRYRLLPYIYSLAGMVTHKDYTIMRALVMDFGNDKNVLNIADQFMFGPSLLINPITQYKARKREVYLPQGYGWYDFHTGKFYEGGQTITANAPYEDIPIFVREGSIIPFGPEIQYSDEKPADPIRLYVYTGKDASFTLYEDENINYNYEKGYYSIIEIKYEEKSKSLMIEKRKGKFPGMLKERIFEIVSINRHKPEVLNFDKQADFKVKYNGEKVTIKLFE